MPCIINRPWPSYVKPTSGLRGPSLALASCRRTLSTPCRSVTQRRRPHVGLSCVAQQNSRVDCPAPQARTPVATFVSYAKLLTLTGAMAAAMLLDRRPAHASTPRPQPVHTVMHTSSTGSKTKPGLWGKLKAAAGAPVGALDRLLFPDEPLEFVRYSAQANTEPSGPSNAQIQAPAATPTAAATAGSSSAHLAPPAPHTLPEDTDAAAPTAAAAAAAEPSDLEGPPASQAGALTAAALLPGSRQLAAAVCGATDRLAASLAHVTSAISPSWPAESVALGAISRLPGELSAAVGLQDAAAAQAAAGVGDGSAGVSTGESDRGAAAAVSPELARQLVRGGYALAGLVVAVMAWQLAAAVAEASKPQRAKRAPDAAPASGPMSVGAAKTPAGTSSSTATSTAVSAPAQGAAAGADALPEQLRGKNVAGPFCLRPIPQQLLQQQQQQQQVPVIELGPTDQLPAALQGKNVVGPFCLLPQITPSLLRQQAQGAPAELQPQDLRGLSGTYKVEPLAHKATPQQIQPQQASGGDAGLSGGQKASGVQEAGARRPLWLHRPSAGPASHGHLSAAAVAAAAATAGALQAEGHSMRQAASAAAADTNSSSSSAPLQHMTAEDAAAASEGVMGAALSAAAAAVEEELEVDSFEAAVQRMVINTRPPKRFSSSSSTSLQPQGPNAAQDQAVSVELTQVAAESAGSDNEPLFRVSLKVTDTPDTAATAVSESLEGRLAAQVVAEALVAESCAAAAAAAAERAQITTHLIEDAIAAHSGHALTLHAPPAGAEEAAAEAAAPAAAAAAPADSSTGDSGTAIKAAGSAAEASWDEGVCCSMAAEVREAEVAAGLYDAPAAAAAAAAEPATQEVPISWQSSAQTAAAPAAAAVSATAQAIPASWRRVESSAPAGAVVPGVAAQQVIPVVWETLASSGTAALTPAEQEIPISWQRAAAAEAVFDSTVTPVDSSSSLQLLVDEAKAAEAAAAAEADAARVAAAAAVARVAAAKAAIPAASAGSAVDVEGLVAEACAAEAAAAEAQAARAAAAAAVARVAAAQAAGQVPPQQQSEAVMSPDSPTGQPSASSAASDDEQARIDQLVDEAKAAEAAAAEADAARAAAAAAVARVAASRSTLVRSAVRAVAAAAADAGPGAVTSLDEPGQAPDRGSQSETGPEPAVGPVGVKTAAAARAAQAELIAEAIAAEAAAFAAEAAAGAAGSAAAAEGSAGDAAEIVKGWLSSSTTGTTSSYSPATPTDSSSSSEPPPPLTVSWVLSGTDESEALAQLTQLAASLGHPAIGPISSSSSSSNDAASDADADAFKDEFCVPNDEEPVTPPGGGEPVAAASTAAAAPSTDGLPDAAQQQQQEASLTAVMDAASRQQMHAASQTALQQTQARVVALYRARRAVGAAAATNTHSTTAQQQQGTANPPAPFNSLTAAGASEQGKKRSSNSGGPKSLQLLSSQLGVSDVALALALASFESSQPDSPTTTISSNADTSIQTSSSSSAGTAASASSVSSSARVSAAGDFEDDDAIEQITVLGSSRDPYAAAAQAIKTSSQSSSISESAELSVTGTPDGVSVLRVSPSDEDDDSSLFATRFVCAESGIAQLRLLRQALAKQDAEEASAAASAAAVDPASKTASGSAASSTANSSSSGSTDAASGSSSPAAKHSSSSNSSTSSSKASTTGSKRIEVVWQTLDEDEPDAFEAAVQRMLINTARPKRFSSTTSAPPAPAAAPAKLAAATKPAAAADTKPAAGAASSNKRSNSGSSVSVLVQGPGSKADSFEVAVQRMVTDTHKAPTKPSADSDGSSNRRSVSPSGPNKGFGKVVRLGPRPQQQQQQRSRPSTPAVLGRVPLHKPRVFSSSSLRPLPWWEQRAAARRTQDNGLGWEGFRTPEAAAATVAEAAAEPASPAAAAGSPAASAAAAPTSIPVEWMDTPTQQKRVQLKERAGAILKQQQPLATSSPAAADAGTSSTFSKVRQLPVGWGGQGAAGEARPAGVLLPRAPKCIVQGPAAAAGPVQEIEVSFEQLASEAEELGVEVSGSRPRAAGRTGFKDMAARAGFKDLSAPYAALRSDVDVSGGGPTKTQQLLQQQKQRQGQQKQKEGQQGGRGGQQQPLRQRPRGFGGQQGGRSSKAPTS